MERSPRTASGERNPKPTRAPSREDLRVSLLGCFEVSARSRVIREEDWRLRKAASLVKLLAISPGHRLHREQAMEILWPDLAPSAAANNLHQTLHAARRTLEPGASTFRYLSLQGEQLVLCPDGQLRVDVNAFEKAAEEARRSQEIAAYQTALELYAGDLLPRDRYEEWTEEHREALRRTYLSLLFELAALYEERGDPGRAIEALREVLASEPAHEEAHVSLMRLYARTGQRYQALRQYEQLRQALRRELGTRPHPSSRQAHEEIMAGHAPPIAAPPTTRPERKIGKHNLPGSLTSFVGREREKEEVERLLGTTRLLTLTGTGGCGKTRLALEVARDLAGAYQDGAWLAELASLTEPELVPQAVADTLRVHEQSRRSLTDTLADALREKDLLLILDNCEHMVDACAPLVETLLRACSRLRILATSREALGAAGEVIWRVRPLSGPTPYPRPAVEELEGYESVRLFVERARYRNPIFILDRHNAGSIAEICRKLDGIPLAIELAAARVGTLAMGQISSRLEDSLRLLTGSGRTSTPRQRTLRGSLDWSHELLDELERRLFRRLSVFADGWTLEAAEAVGSGDGTNLPVLDLISRLVDKSLVAAEVSDNGGARYRMLEPVRQYAREKLEQNGEAGAVGCRHAEYYLALGERVEPELVGARQVEWLERLETERNNLRTALSWALVREDAEREGRAELGLRLATALGRFWGVYGVSEGLNWLERGLARSATSSKLLRAKALNEVGWIALWQGDYEGSETALEESRALFEDLGDRSGVAASLASLGLAVLLQGDKARATALREEADKLRREPLDRQTLAHVLISLARIALQEGDYERTTALGRESLALNRELEDRWGIAQSLMAMGFAELALGDHEGAAASFEEALRLLRTRGDQIGVSFSLLGLAGVASEQLKPERAARLWGAAEALRETVGLRFSPSDRSHLNYENRLTAARSLLGDEAFAAAWTEGRATSLEEAIEYALAAEEPASDAPGPLSPREREIASLIAQGLTRRRIASELSISPRTVDTHVGKIFKKLGVSSRNQVTARLAEERLTPPDTN